MPVLVIVNPKGASAKPHWATQIAGYWARCGHAVMLGDGDRRRRCAHRLRQRPAQARPIAGWDASRSDVLKPPRGTMHVMLDTPAGLHGQRPCAVLRQTDGVRVPMQPGSFDIYATYDSFCTRCASARPPAWHWRGGAGGRAHAGGTPAAGLCADVSVPLVAQMHEAQVYCH